MSRCPQCHHQLSFAARREGECPRCHVRLSAASTVDLGPADATLELDAANAVGPPSAGDATLDLAASAAEIHTVELIQQTWAGTDGSVPPEMTLKSAATPPPNDPSKSLLVVRDREVRAAESDQLGVADYDLIARLGEGGMGVVYTARQASIDRTVAVKMLKPATAQDDAQRQKFLSEAVVTGELDHPNIVPIYELGRNSDGSLFYSMKKIQGTPWMEVLSKRSSAENLEILMKVADAVAFAHSRGVVHRDLKPENIMLGEFGEVLVLDWGLALTTTDCRKSASLSAPVGMGGTPAYMAPEMVLGPVEKIGKHSDIYLLGAILYECVTGSPPHDGRNAMQCLFAAGKNEIRPTTQQGELVEIALRAMATDPADRFSSVQAFQQAIRTYQSHSESIALTVRATEELEQARQQDDYQQLARALYVFEEACELWPENTQAKIGVANAKLAYAESAYRKGDYDLGLSVVDAGTPAHERLIAQLKTGQRDRAARQQRLRNAKRAIAALALLVFVAVTTGMLLFLIQKKEADRQRAMAVANEEEASRQRDEAGRQRDEAERQRIMALQNEATAKQQEQIAITQRARAEVSEQEAVEKRKAAEYEAYIAWIGLADSKIKENAPGQARDVLQQCTPHLRDWEWYRLMFQCRQGLSRIQVGQRMDCVAVSPDGRAIAAGSRDGIVRVWDRQRGELLHELSLDRSFATSMAFCPSDPQLLAIASGEPDKQVRLWNLGSDKVTVVPVGHTDRVTNIAFSPDGSLLLTASFDHTAVIWNLAEQRRQHVLQGHSWWVWSAQFSHDGRRIVTASQDGTVRIWDVDTGRPLLNARNEPMPFSAHEGPVYTARFSPDDRSIASGGHDGRILLWGIDDLRAFDYRGLLQDGRQTFPKFEQLEGHAAAVSRIVFSRDGRLIVSAGHDNLIKVWWAQDQDEDGVRVARGTLYKTLRGHDSLVRDIVSSPADTDLLISASYDGQVRLWAVDEYEESRVIPGVVLRGHSDAILQATFSPSDDRIVTASRDRSARVWNAHDGRAELVLREGHAYLTSSAAFFPASQRKLLTGAVDGTARVWDLDAGTQQAVLAGIGPGAAAAVSPDGNWLATSADAAEAVSGTRYAKLWDARTGQVVWTLGQHQAAISAVVFSADSRQLFTGDANGRGNLWDVQTGAQLATTRRHTGRISAAVFTASGQWLLTASEDKTVFQWPLALRPEPSGSSAPELAADDTRVLRHPQAVTSLALAEAGDAVLTGCQDGTVRFWDSPSARVRWQWQSPSGGNINAVDVAAQGTLGLAVDAVNNVVCLLEIETGREVRVPDEDGAVGHFLNLRKQGALGWSARFSPDGQYVVTVGGDEARLWDLQGRERMSFGPHRTVSSAAFSPDGTQIATVSWDNSAKLWDAQQGQPLRKLDDHTAGDLRGHAARINSVAYSPIAPELVTSSDDGTLRIWNAATGQVLRTLIGHQGPVVHAAYSADGHSIVSSSRDATAIVWDAASGQLRQRLAGHRLPVLHAAFSPDGTRIVTGSEDFRALVWDAQRGDVVATLPDQTDRVTSVAFSPTGSRILTGCADQSVKLWDAVTGREVLTLAGHTREVTSVSFSGDGQMVLSSSRDGTAIVWPALAPRADGQYEFDVPVLTLVR